MQAFRSTAHSPWQRALYHDYLPLPMAAGSITFCPPGWHMHARQKEKRRTRTDCEAEAERKTPVVPKENHGRKQTAATKKVTVTDKSSKEFEGLKRPVSSTGSLRSFAVFEQLKGEFVGDGADHSVSSKATCISFRNKRSRQIHHGDIRQQVLGIDEDRERANSQHHCRLLCWTTTTVGRQNKTYRSARQNGEAGKTPGIDSLRFSVCTR